MRRFKNSLAIAVLMACVALVSCGPPAAVRKLSAAQLAIQTNYHETLRAYFAVVERYVEAQLQIVAERYESRSRERLDLLEKDYADDLEGASDPEERKKIIKVHTDATVSEVKRLEERKARVRQLMDQLKAKQGEMLQAHTAIIQAQKTLDHYIQFKKVDEVLANELTGVVGLNRDTINQALTDIARIADDIERMSTTMRE